MRTIFQKLVLPAGAAVAIAVPAQAAPAPAPDCPDADVVPTAEHAPEARAAILCLLNAERDRHHAPALHAERHLKRAAQAYAQALGPTGPLGHVSRTGSTPEARMARAGYAPARRETFTYAEWLARAFGDAATPAERVSGWLEAGGRSLLLSRRYRHAGIGLSIRQGRVTFVLDLAGPGSSS